jgi:hypothetical protein
MGTWGHAPPMGGRGPAARGRYPPRPIPAAGAGQSDERAPNHAQPARRPSRRAARGAEGRSGAPRERPGGARAVPAAPEAPTPAADAPPAR